MNPQVSVTPRLVSALDQIWNAIRTRHPDVPETVITLGAGSLGARSGLKLGHFAPDRWQRADNHLPEVFVGGEGLQLGAEAVLDTLLHEAAHGIAHARGIQATSRQGRWHNARYKVLAEELGLRVTTTANLGWSSTDVPDTTIAIYARETRELQAALVVWRHAERTFTTRGRRSNNNGLIAKCACGRRIRVARRTYARGPIICGPCGTVFVVGKVG